MHKDQIPNSERTHSLGIRKDNHLYIRRAKNQGSPRIHGFQRFVKRNAYTLIKAWILIGFVFAGPTFGITVASLQAPIADLKTSLFGGWMWIAKIGAAVGGCVMAVYQRDIVPLATGAAVGLGIHFYDSYFTGYFGQNVAQAALI